MGRRRKKPPGIEPFDAVIVTCEHASNAVPAQFAPRFRGAGTVLRTHRGYDLGALPLARSIATALRAPLLVGRYTRLLVDLNRSPGNRGLFSEFTRDLDPLARALLVDRYWSPHRAAVEEAISREIEAGGRVLHLGVHSFTPVLNGVVRTADFALLYDPRRPLERECCDRWLENLGGRAQNTSTPLRLRRNYPYLGTSDGLTTALRKRFPANLYAGVEIEFNQRLLAGKRVLPRAVTKAVVSALVPPA